MKDDNLGKTEKLLVIQFLGVLHTWLQEQRLQRESELAVLAAQESLVKLLFARVSRPDLYSEPEFSEAGKLIFSEPDQNWHDVFSREKDTLADAGVELNETDLSSTGDVIDFFTREIKNPTKESDE